MKNKAVKNRRSIHAAIFVLITVVFIFASGCSRAWDDIETPAQNPRSTGLETAGNISAGRRAASSGGGVIEIKERLFISQVNDVYVNIEDYLGKTIKIEGIFKQELYDEKEEPYRFVIRYGPGCCGYDGNVGFEIAWAEGSDSPYPAVDSWVEVVGVVKTYEENEGFQYVYLDLASLNVSDKRGTEIVSQ